MGQLQIDKMKATGAIAVQLTQALKNMVEASGGMLDNRTALLQMAQLEQTVQDLITGANSANSIIDGMAQQPGNQNTGNVPAVPPSGANGGIPTGAGGGQPDNAGAGGGLT